MTISGKQHHLYLADDPLGAPVYVMAPLSADVRALSAAGVTTVSGNGESYLSYKKLQVYMLVDKAYARTQQ